MSKQVYTHASRVALYRSLIEKVGIFNLNKWHKAADKPLACPATPSGFNTQAEEALYQEIYDEITPKHFNGRLPKSAKALMQQVRWCMSIQPTENNNQRRLKTRNRLAAYEAGFMLMSDIVKLEAEEQTRHDYQK